MYLVNLPMPESCRMCPINVWNTCKARIGTIGEHIEFPSTQRLPSCPLIDLGGTVPSEFVPVAKQAALKAISGWQGDASLLYQGQETSELEQSESYNRRVIPGYEKQIYKQAQEQCGDLVETVVALEEMAELIKELCKFLRGMGNREHIVEEMSDVLVGVGQMLVMFDAEAETLVAKENKLKRLVQRLHDGTA